MALNSLTSSRKAPKFAEIIQGKEKDYVSSLWRNTSLTNTAYLKQDNILLGFQPGKSENTSYVYAFTRESGHMNFRHRGTQVAAGGPVRRTGDIDDAAGERQRARGLPGVDPNGTQRSRHPRMERRK